MSQRDMYVVEAVASNIGEHTGFIVYQPNLEMISGAPMRAFKVPECGRNLSV